MSKLDLEFNDYVEIINGNLGKTEWITVACFHPANKPEVEQGTFFLF